MWKGPDPKTLELLSLRDLRLKDIGQMLEELPVGAELGSHSSLGDQSSPRGNATGLFCKFCKYRITAQGLLQQCNHNKVFEETEIKQFADSGNLVAGGL